MEFLRLQIAVWKPWRYLVESVVLPRCGGAGFYLFAEVALTGGWWRFFFGEALRKGNEGKITIRFS